MSLKLLGFIGTAVTGVLGVGTVIVFGSGMFDGKNTNESSVGSGSSSTGTSTDASGGEDNKEWQFLYKLFKKIFDASSKLEGTDAHGKDNAIKLLKEKFSGTLENEEDKWENFKSLCEAQKSKETKSGEDVDNEYSRVCFVDSGENPKGYLWKWYTDDQTKKVRIDKDGALFALDLSKKNHDLWSEFKTKYPNQNPIDKFDEWYDSGGEAAKNVKGAIDKIK